MTTGENFKYLNKIAEKSAQFPVVKGNVDYNIPFDCTDNERTFILLKELKTNEWRMLQLSEFEIIGNSLNVHDTIDLSKYTSIIVKQVGTRPTETVGYTTLRALTIEQLKEDQRNCVEHLQNFYDEFEKRILKLKTPNDNPAIMTYPVPEGDGHVMIWRGELGWVSEYVPRLGEEFDEWVAKLEAEYQKRLKGITDEGTKQVSAVQAEGTIQRAIVVQGKQEMLDEINRVGASNVTLVNQAGASQVHEVQLKGNGEIQKIIAEGSKQKEEVAGVGTQNIVELNNLKDSSMRAVQAIVDNAYTEINDYTESVQMPKLKSYGDAQIFRINEHVTNDSIPKIDNHVDGVLEGKEFYYVQGSCGKYTGSEPNVIARVIKNEDPSLDTLIKYGVAPQTSRPSGIVTGTIFIAKEDFKTKLKPNGDDVYVRTGDFLVWYVDGWSRVGIVASSGVESINGKTGQVVLTAIDFNSVDKNKAIYSEKEVDDIIQAIRQEAITKIQEIERRLNATELQTTKNTQNIATNSSGILDNHNNITTVTSTVNTINTNYMPKTGGVFTGDVNIAGGNLFIGKEKSIFGTLSNGNKTRMLVVDSNNNLLVGQSKGMANSTNGVFVYGGDGSTYLNQEDGGGVAVRGATTVYGNCNINGSFGVRQLSFFDGDINAKENITFNNGKGVRGLKKDGTNVNLAFVSSSDVIGIGSTNVNECYFYAGNSLTLARKTIINAGSDTALTVNGSTSEFNAPINFNRTVSFRNGGEGFNMEADESGKVYFTLNDKGYTKAKGYFGFGSGVANKLQVVNHTDGNISLEAMSGVNTSNGIYSLGNVTAFQGATRALNGDFVAQNGQVLYKADEIEYTRDEETVELTKTQYDSLINRLNALEQKVK